MADGAYLPPNTCGGCPYCFDPDSVVLRRALIEPTPTPEDNVDTARLAADVQWYHRLLQYHYAGYIDLLRAPAFDVAAFFAEWARDLRRHIGVVRLRDALGEPLVRLSQVLPDGHRVFPAVARIINADDRVVFHEYQAVVDADTDTAPDAAEIAGALPSTSRIVPMLRADGTLTRVATVSATGPGETRAGGRLRLRRRAPPTRPPQSPVYAWHTVGDTTVITLRRFGGPFPATRELEQFPADYPLHTRRSTIVFDLRGNGGGSLQYTEGWIARGLGGALRRQPLLDFAPCGCCEWNRAVEAQVRAVMVDTPGARQERADALTAIQMEWAHRSPVARLALRIPAAERPGSAPYSGRVFALIDRGTGSSGELTALELRRNLNALVIGERSGGGMQYGQLGTFVLPGTGLVCRIPTRRFFHDGAVEGVGVPVDLYLQDIGMDVDAVVRTVMKSEAVGQAIPV